MENFNYKGYRANNILKSFQKGGMGSGRHSIDQNSHSIDSNGNVVNNNPEQQSINEKFKHHRLMAAYHAAKTFEHNAKGDKENVKIHSQEGQKHVQLAKKLHNKKEHGGWMESIPNTKEAKEYGEKHYKQN